MTNDKDLIVLTGPSGVGKGTLVKKLLAYSSNIWLSISATTRSPREGEVNGEDYIFLNKLDFQKLIENNGLLEWAEFAGNLYGTPKVEVNTQLSLGKKVLLEIELDGARQVRETFPNGFQIFIAPPDFHELEKRIRNRGTDSEEAISKRLLRAKDELNAQKEFDAIVINDNIDIAFNEIKQLIGI